MTLSNIRTQILTHFLEKDVFLFSDVAKIKVPEDLSKINQSLVAEAMKELEENKIVKKIVDNEGVDKGWILETKLGAHGQEVYVSLPLANGIAMTINSYIEANELQEEKCNALNLSERDINALLMIISNLIKEDE